MVECEGRTYHRNRKDLCHTPETVDPVSETTEETMTSVPHPDTITEDSRKVNPTETNIFPSKTPAEEAPQRVSSSGCVIKTP